MPSFFTLLAAGFAILAAVLWLIAAILPGPFKFNKQGDLDLHLTRESANKLRRQTLANAGAAFSAGVSAAFQAAALILSR